MFLHTAAAPAQGVGWLAVCLLWAYQAYQSVTRRYKLHQPEHVGMFAGSLLPVKDWDRH
jgi:hypothetical protein